MFFSSEDSTIPLLLGSKRAVDVIRKFKSMEKEELQSRHVKNYEEPPVHALLLTVSFSHKRLLRCMLLQFASIEYFYDLQCLVLYICKLFT